MKKIKNDSGITLITLVVTIIIMLILIISVTASMTSTIELKKYNSVKEDIIAFTEEVKLYYLSNGTLPVIKNADGTYDETKTYNLDDYSVPQEDRNPNDSGKYYFIDISLLDIKLNNGTGNKNNNYTTTDVYVVNEKSLTVYYLQGAVLDNRRHYTIVDDFAGGSYAEDYYSKVNLPIISVVTMESNGKNKYLAGIGDTITLKILTNYSLTTVPTVTINNETVEVTWNGNIGTATYVVPETYDIAQYGTQIPLSISNYSADNRTGEEITNVTIGQSVYSYNKKVYVNRPNIKIGMTPIKFKEATSTSDGQAITTTENDETWYDYGAKHWANAQTEDGSMWVWIPRFAYRLNGDGKTFDIVFLIGTTDTYYDQNGNIQTNVKRATASFTPDTSSTEYYTVHPAFTNESSIGYKNGGWDTELTGIWVAKFEAGYASGGNTAPVKASSVNYTQTTVWAATIEVKTEYPEATADGGISARNWLDGVYGSTTTAIKYPTFQGSTYSMNYINAREAFSVSKALTESGNIYGLTGDTDSHLMKNSEWGAVSYLSQSKYGLNGTDIDVNTMNKNNGGVSTSKADGNALASVYAVTGYNNSSKEWNDYLNGTASASTTGNIYGIYDFSGGLWERTAAYIANNHSYLVYGNSFTNYVNSTTAYQTTSTKYSTVYPYSNPENSDYTIASQANWEANTQIYGDAVRETSQKGTDSNPSTFYYGDYSFFPSIDSTFFTRGGSWPHDTSAGLFCFHRANGASDYANGFRAVLV